MFPYDPVLCGAVKTPPQSIGDVLLTLRTIQATCIDGWRDPSEWTGLNCSSASFGWFFLLGFLVVLSIKWATNWSPDLSIIAPGQCVARMPGTGPLRRSSVLARKKAIVGKSLVEAES